MKRKVGSLTPKQEKDLVKSLNDFAKWLFKKNILKSPINVRKTVSFPFANEDWIMKVEGTDVSFNTFVSERCSFDFYKAIVLHEFFHLEVQKVPNKEDAVRVKDDFGDELMKLIDIEADFYTALFYKEKLKYGLVKYLELYYEGRTIFNDIKIRIIKFERFIGTLLSIAKMHILYSKKTVIDYDLYLPAISPIYTEERLHILVIKKEHIYFEEIRATHADFVSLKDCYTNIDRLTKKGYVENLIKFVYSALEKEIPKEIKNDINKIKN